MSTVLWANVLAAGEVKSDQGDCFALYKHAGKLDSIATSLGLPSFVGICDTTDQRFNLEDKDLPAGMTSTDELMAAEGVWMPIKEAVNYLQALRDHVVQRNVRFGLLSNQQSEVVKELDEVIVFVNREAPSAQKFNFSVVM